MRYFANPCSADVISAMRENKLGFIGTPAQGNARPDGVVWCADNGCFSARWNEAKWWAFLTRHAADTDRCVFAVAPDVVGDAAGTAVKSRPWLDKIRGLGYPVAYVGQDGQENLPTPWDDIDAFFIGGSTDWKLGQAAADLTAEAKARGKYVHMGRVNSLKRLRYAVSIGCDSVDGTYLTYGPDVNLPKLLRWLDVIEAERKNR